MTYVLSLWIITHALADLGGSFGKRKPFNCQLCLSGWLTLIWSAGDLIATGRLDQAPTYLSYWALSVLVEAVHQRLYIMTL